jgi:uncharacterized protein
VNSILEIEIDTSNKGDPITTLDQNGVVMGDQHYDSSFIISPMGEISQWALDKFEDLTIEDFRRFESHNPEFVILGTGRTHCFPTPDLYRPLIESNIGLECMSTAAACRTYNLISNDGRDITLAVIIQDQSKDLNEA